MRFANHFGKGANAVKFFVIGDVTVDHIYFLQRIPQPGEEVAPTRSTLLPGGAGGTMAYHLAQLGHQVVLAARVGNDPFQTLALEQVKAVGVKLQAIQHDPVQLTSNITILVTPDAERAMISSGDANRNLDVALLEAKELESCQALLVSAYSLIAGKQREYAIKAIELAKATKIPVFVDLGTGAVNAAGTQLIEGVKQADYLLMNQLELLRITATGSISDALQGLQKHGINRVIVKVGAQGSIVWTPQETELLDGYAISDVIDTTGSGDAFTAAFADAILEGLPINAAARYANIAGAIVATHTGGQTAKLERQDLLKRLGQQPIEPNPKPKAPSKAPPSTPPANTTKAEPGLLEPHTAQPSPVVEPSKVNKKPVRRTVKT